MRIFYCIHSLYNSGGMERIIVEKANFLAKKGIEVSILTTEQQDKPIFYQLEDNIKHIDLGINYSEYNSLFLKIITLYFKEYKHKKSLKKIIARYRPDVVISTFENEASFLTELKDQSKKILEFHFSKGYRLAKKRKGLLFLVDWYRTQCEVKIAKKFEHFIVLTEEDKLSWHQLSNVSVIPNFIHLTPESSSFSRKELLSIGRLSYQKGFDRLIKAFKIVHETYPEWKLIIYGDGEEKDKLLGLIEEYNLVSFVVIHRPVKNVEEIYCNSSCFVLTSRYEGLPMVLLEAMSYGLPIISYDCKCGPKDLINNGLNGFLVPEGNIEELANTIMKLISNRDTMIEMGRNAKVESQQYEREVIMQKWIDLFEK